MSEDYFMPEPCPVEGCEGTLAARHDLGADGVRMICDRNFKHSYDRMRGHSNTEDAATE